MLVAIVVLFAICWTPTMIDNVLIAFEHVHRLHYGNLKPMRQAFALMSYFNSCVNPIVYAFMSRNFRNSFKNALCRACLSHHGERRDTLRHGTLRSQGGRQLGRFDSSFQQVAGERRIGRNKEEGISLVYTRSGLCSNDRNEGSKVAASAINSAVSVKNTEMFEITSHYDCYRRT